MEVLSDMKQENPEELPALKIGLEEHEISEGDDEVLSAAHKAFGISYFFPWQRIVIANILDSVLINKESVAEQDDRFFNGRQIVLLPTGAGKSLCFLTPALLLKGPTLVLYPLLALMSDQKRRMDEGGILCAVFKGGQTDFEREENFQKIRDGAKIILTNPESLQSQSLVERLCGCGILHIAIDEAHCVSEWGDSFRPAYLILGDIIQKINPPAVTAFTATASPEVLSRVSQVLFGGEAHIIRSAGDRPNIHYKVINTYAKKRTAFLLAHTEKKPLIIFCGTRARAEDMARELSFFCGKDKVRFYHAGMERSEKSEVEKWFYPKTDAILCCTCAFGMGVDKKDIRTVIHLEPSPTAESYVQEAGRGGRDGSVANAILLWSYNDHLKAEKIPDSSREKCIQKFAESRTCRRQVILDALGEGEERPACDGCDICVRGKGAGFAKDAALVLKLVKRFPNHFTQEELSRKSAERLNKSALKKSGLNVYEHSDCEEIISQLKKQNLIRERNFPFNRLIAPVKKAALPFHPGR